MDLTASVIISPEWCNRPVEQVAPDLIGCTLVRHFSDGHQLRGMIVETEAYGPNDPACHGYRGRTPRTAVMFGPAGMSYVYLIYGMYHCFNVVTDSVGVASAVLIRALHLDPLSEWGAEKNGKHPHRMAAGPGKLCQALKIDRRLSDRPLQPPSDAQTFSTDALWLEHRSIATQQNVTTGKWKLHQTTRIGLSKATETPWRWYLKGSACISKP